MIIINLLMTFCSFFCQLNIDLNHNTFMGPEESSQHPRAQPSSPNTQDEIPVFDKSDILKSKVFKFHSPTTLNLLHVIILDADYWIASSRSYRSAKQTICSSSEVKHAPLSFFFHTSLLYFIYPSQKS